MARHAPEQHIDALQPAQRLQEQCPVTHRQVPPLDQGAAEVAGEQQVLRPVRVGGPACQHGDGRRLLRAGRRGAEQRLAPRVEKRPQLADGSGPEQLRRHLRQQAPRFPSDADPGRTVGAVRDHAPLAVRAADQVGGVGLEMGWTRDRAAAAGTEEAGIGEHERGRQGAVRQGRLLPVQVREQRLQQARALDQALFQKVELARGDREWDRVAAPDVRRAFLFCRTLQPGRPIGEAGTIEAVDGGKDGAPVRPNAAPTRHHLVKRRHGRAGTRALVHKSTRAGVGRCTFSSWVLHVSVPRGP